MPDENVFVIQVPGFVRDNMTMVMLGEPDERHLPYVTHTGRVTWTEVINVDPEPVAIEGTLPLDMD